MNDVNAVASSQQQVASNDMGSVVPPSVFPQPTTQPDPSSSMFPQNIQSPTTNNQPPTTMSDPAVDDIVAQAGAIQDLFKQNDEKAGDSGQSSPPKADQPLDEMTNQPPDQDFVSALGAQTAQLDPSSSVGKLGIPQDDVFSDNLLTGQASTSLSTNPADGGTQLSTASNPQSPTTSDPNQKSPLDILEEILQKEEQKNKAQTPAAEEGPSPEDVARHQQQEAENQIKIEEARKQMMAERESEEQKQRDAIRQQQMDANKIHNPYEIRQLEHKKVVR